MEGASSMLMLALSATELDYPLCSPYKCAFVFARPCTGFDRHQPRPLTPTSKTTCLIFTWAAAATIAPPHLSHHLVPFLLIIARCSPCAAATFTEATRRHAIQAADDEPRRARRLERVQRVYAILGGQMPSGVRWQLTTCRQNEHMSRGSRRRQRQQRKDARMHDGNKNKKKRKHLSAAHTGQGDEGRPERGRCRRQANSGGEDSDPASDGPLRIEASDRWKF